jgi:hypothetical protein
MDGSIDGWMDGYLSGGDSHVPHQLDLDGLVDLGLDDLTLKWRSVRESH